MVLFVTDVGICCCGDGSGDGGRGGRGGGGGGDCNGKV